MKAGLTHDEDLSAGSVFRASGGQRHARQHGGGQLARGCGQFVDGGAAAGEKAGLLKKVGGRIAADGELGENRQARAQIRGAAAGGDNFFQISGEISDRGIDLAKCDLHSFSLNGETGGIHGGKVLRRITRIPLISGGLEFQEWKRKHRYSYGPGERARDSNRTMKAMDWKLSTSKNWT